MSVVQASCQINPGVGKCICSVPHTGQVRYLLQEPGPPQRQVPADFGLRLLQLIECYYLILYIYAASAQFLSRVYAAQ